ncbi:hypothetical protein HUB98_05490 [Paenibacillus barcinonensis]|uniref:Uncharacterized protein n=1 Tax=Paenibacillus barcinonensis TaxID=198119 RepID=A0A2V4VCZ4_PAEBA|nr:hypothetical protein [Paenibacillus barcinonensis]PYE51442.1 hypothetical protein DFQ00_102236 [Paenibacillus barcinonensis]QKS55835.1 hypothetical protein HUB98_05490 [Paenibacillus barcinonensis]
MPAPKQFVNGKWVHGGAAQQHIIKKNGGWDQHHEELIETAIKDFAKEQVSQMNEKAKKPRLKRAK